MSLPESLDSAHASPLQQRLRAASRWDAEYLQGGEWLSSHLPIALAALHRLGAAPERLDSFGAAYVPRLQPAPPIEAWPDGEPWRAHFGQPAAWPRYRHLFRQWLAHMGAEGLLQQALPWLLPGCGAVAFHGMIRTAYAFESIAPEELADALAYWACRWMDLGAPEPDAAADLVTGGDERQPSRLLPALMALPASADGLIAQRMHAAVRHLRFEPLVAALHIDAATLPRLARLAAQCYARSGNFTVLHLVTSAHALRVLLPFVEDGAPTQQAVAAYWRAYAAGVVAAHATLGRAGPLLEWPAITAAALASDDDHLVKIVDACRQEQQAHGGAPDWQRAASRAVHDARRRGGGTRPGSTGPG